MRLWAKGKTVIILIVTASILVVLYDAFKKILSPKLVSTVNVVGEPTPTNKPSPTESLPSPTESLPSPTVTKVNRKLSDDFGRIELIKEMGYMRESSSKNWWLNSGAYFYVNSGIAKTISGELPSDDPRRIDYHEDNPAETDDGFHPQNIFRLVTRSKWINYEQSVYFKINRYILSSDSHRQASNGILLFNRYQGDGQTLYYAGLRVDGFTTIKKKYQGTYYTMSYKSFLPGKYDRDLSPNLIPLGNWIGVKTKVANMADGSVSIKLYLDSGKTGNWSLVAEAVDEDNKYSGTPPISQEGFAGIRTDFMDAEFQNYKIEEF